MNCMPKISGDWDVKNRMYKLCEALEENLSPLPDVLNITEAFKVKVGEYADVMLD